MAKLDILGHHAKDYRYRQVDKARCCWVPGQLITNRLAILTFESPRGGRSPNACTDIRALRVLLSHED